jgi:hypothetical protein
VVVRTGRSDRSTGVLALGLWALVLACPAAAAGRQPQGAVAGAAVAAPTWFRLFLLDGQILATIGEFTRVDDVVMLQVPIESGADAATPDTRTVTIPASIVDWTRTEAYRDALRQAQFEQSGGQRAYAAFTEEVAATLRDVAVLPDPLERIRRLEAARAQLAQWPAAHHGYRADEVARTLSVVDDLLNGMRAAAGQQTFALALSTGPAVAAPATPSSLLPPPTLQDMVAQALRLAPRVSDPVERLQLLRSAEAMLGSASALDRGWVRSTQRQVRRQIETEAGVTRRYERLRSWMLDRTARLLAAADVRGLMRLRDQIISRDTRLERQRPAEVASLLATLDARLETARRRRLLLERWTEHRPAVQKYASLVTPHLASGTALAKALEEVKALSGPAPALLSQAEGQLASARAGNARVPVPDEARTVQQLWGSAQQLAARALQARRAAVRSGNLQQAWEASAAAAGALMLIQQLRVDVATLLQGPALPASPGR